MPSPTIEKAQNPNGLIVGCISVASVLILASLSKASIWATFCVAIFSIIVLWLYFRTLRPIKASPLPSRVDHDISELRGEILQEVTDSFPRAIAILDRNSIVIHANKFALDMLSQDMIGRPISAYLRTSHLRSHMEQAFNGEFPPTLSVHVHQPTERYLDVDFSNALILRQETKREAVIIAVLADRTQANTEREQRADFLANASHELKTPIASMKGYIETLRGHARNDPAAREKFLGIMAEQADRMERLVNDLLSLRRIESSEHIAPSETADLRRAIEAARDALELQAKTRNVKLIVNLPDADAAPTSGKTDECVQLFLNLIENAIKLSPEKSTVSVTLEWRPNWTGEAFPPTTLKDASFRRIVNLILSDDPIWRVVISDSGPGFSRTHLPRIGERFYRVAGDLPAQEKGTGLGLAIVKHIVMRHRAGLFVKSLHAEGEKEAPSGTSFSVIFKAVNPEN